ncbi:interleukin-5 receptor subunit alpha-like isoform X2 [Myxocyprinus asiaticus]|uniref:interleukin-5 receptor subunit alpha-like isoform X2 n=1 Tax=Myxocyprinus asiaticus TaxID=70543 RepID=UPI0022229CDF|nr:interleukin-5 receptor subunit alpha-like isoform X2 [Myxocyprinus asiaticus]XP_051559023.1 interleukin-5 receptor subunit alpha-like isoform X2 [Myxocyprinus asiaticus]
MICEAHLPRVIRLRFILTFGLILILSFTKPDTELSDEGNDICVGYEDMHCADIYIRKSDGSMDFHFKHSFKDVDNQTNLYLKLPPTLHYFNFDNITCILDMKDQLNCSWNITGLPKNAQYSAYVVQENSNHQLNCSHNVANEAVECHGHNAFKHLEHVVVKVNVSIPKHWYVVGKEIHKGNIVKLDPPNNINISNRLNELEINWTIPEAEMYSKNTECYKYELQINDEVVPLSEGQLSYSKKDIDLTRKYAIKMRVILSKHCFDAIYWSDWSNVLEVGPFEKVYQVNPWVIIAFVLPMLLLSFLLICKCQRLTEKLFPPIPSPSVNVKKLLEKDNFCQHITHICVEYDKVTTVYGTEERNG